MKVANYRDSIEALKRTFYYDRNMCVGNKEKARWFESFKRELEELKRTECKRAKLADNEEKEEIIKAVFTYLQENSIPIYETPFELGSSAYKNGVKALCHDEKMAEWVRANTDGKVGSGLEAMKQ